MNPLPAIVTVDPVAALIGLTLEIVGAAALAVEGASKAPTTTISKPKRRARGAAPHIPTTIGSHPDPQDPQNR